MTTPNVRLHIDRLVLDEAFAHLDRAAVGAAVERELGRLLAERGTPGGLGETARVARVDGGRFGVEWGAGAEAVGRRVARGIYGGMGQ